MQKGINQIKTQYEKEIVKHQMLEKLGEEGSKRKIHHMLRIRDIEKHISKQYKMFFTKEENDYEYPY
jgi:hypothetical protein